LWFSFLPACFAFNLASPLLILNTSKQTIGLLALRCMLVQKARVVKPSHAFDLESLQPSKSD
jgi:hypothetical protein